MSDRAALLRTLERYYDEVPRVQARGEDIGPFTLFAPTEPDSHPFYARPRLGSDQEPTVAAVEEVRRRQRELGLPEAFEWVQETTPTLAAVVEMTGLAVQHHPLLVLHEPVPVPEAVSVRVLAADDVSLSTTFATVHAAFGDSDDVVPRPAGDRPTSSSTDTWSWWRRTTTRDG